MTSSLRGPLALYVLLTANTLSWQGNAIAAIALPWFVLSTTQSPALTGIIAACQTVPAMMASLLGGPLVDRLGLRRTSVLSDVMSAVCVLAVPLLHAGQWLSFPLLCVLVFLGALLDAPGATARASLLPELSQRAAWPLERTNTLSELLESGSGWIAPLLAGTLVAALGAPGALWINALSFALSAALVRMGVPDLRPSPEPGPVGGGVLEGLRFVLRDGPLRVIFGSSVVFSASMAALFGVMLPVLARQEGGALGLGGLLSAFGAGSLLGALAFGVWGARWSRRWTFVISVGGLWLIFAVLALSSDLRVALGAMFVGGLIAGPNGPLIPTILQERTPAALRARVFGASAALTLAASPLGLLLVGAATEWAGLRPVLLGVAAVFAAALLGVLLDRGLELADTQRPVTAG
ncbi:MFS family permease [Deinobacterium chartae]|uniref:MFS family permease n=1 Tax=Deinobacterium chartae TaxID=521158 RepID=A0A841I7U2_9DEIO|nr:MFS transporter [Deinobacterium chartae]MBB6099912.1 MFS family permease [Deinobacterium chartae]